MVVRLDERGWDIDVPAIGRRDRLDEQFVLKDADSVDQAMKNEAVLRRIGEYLFVFDADLRIGDFSKINLLLDSGSVDKRSIFNIDRYCVKDILVA